MKAGQCGQCGARLGDHHMPSCDRWGPVVPSECPGVIAEALAEVQARRAVTEQLAVVKGVGFGNRDIGQPCLWFSTYVADHTSALQVLTGPDMLKAVQDSGVDDIKELEGSACWVVVTNNKIEFLRFWRFP